MKSIHIYDLDGTLVDSSHRYRARHNGIKWTIDLAHWLANIDQCDYDTLTPLALQYQDQLSDPDIYTIWCTARTLKQCILAFPWLKNNLGLPNKFFMRPNYCDIGGGELKCRQLSSFLNQSKFRNIKRYFYEDNRLYLDAVCNRIDAVPVFIPSIQGH